MRRVLVVANRTVGGEELAAVIRDRLEAGECEFHLLVPVPPTPPIGIAAGFSAMEAGVTPALQGPDERQLADRTPAVRAGLDGAASGRRVDGEVGDSDAIRAVRSVIESRQIDEIIISTLPTTISRWLRQDLPSRVERKFSLPVTVVTATIAPAEA